MGEGEANLLGQTADMNSQDGELWTTKFMTLSCTGLLWT